MSVLLNQCMVPLQTRRAVICSVNYIKSRCLGLSLYFVVNFSILTKGI